MKFKDKVVIITGASRGIGKAIALLFAREGAKVVVDYHVSDIEPDAKENAFSVVKSIKEIGSDAMAIRCDVSNEVEVKELVRKSVEKFNKIDILVNNAGIVFDLSFSQRTSEQWIQTLNVNLFGTFLCSKYISKEMRDEGKIINISSTNGMDAICPDSIDYNASKAGIVSFTKSLAKELAPRNIMVNSIAPGWVDTDMNKDLPDDYVKEEIEKIYLKRFARPEEIAKVALFLASDGASFVNGSILKVDGGYD